VEWLVGPPLDADVRFHAGELDCEAVAGLIARAALVYCSPGFAIPLSQAIGTPVVAVFGGHESARFYDIGNRFTPTLGIDPVRPCECFSRSHNCDKTIDVATAATKVARFIAAYCVNDDASEYSASVA
jgi:ADP-heptose:LPS heptosyltransferase